MNTIYTVADQVSRFSELKGTLNTTNYVTSLLFPNSSKITVSIFGDITVSHFNSGDMEKVSSVFEAIKKVKSYNN